MTASTTWISDVLRPPRSVVRSRHIRYWISIFGLALADGLSFFIADVLIRRGHTVPELVLYLGRNAGGPTTPISSFALLAVVFVVVRYLSGDYGRRQLFWDGAKTTTIALLVTCLPDLVMLAVGNGVYSAWAVFLSWALLLFLLPLMRQGARVLMSRIRIWQIPTALIGISSRSHDIWTALSSSLSLGFDVRWLVIEDQNMSPPAGLALLKPIRSTDAADIASTICSEGCKEAVIAAEEMQSPHLAEVVQRLLEVNVPVAIIPALNRLPLANATTNYFFGRDILLMQVRSNVQRLPSRFAKRLFDIIVSCLLLVCLSPLFLIVAAAIKRSGPGPLTFSQTRIGRDGVPFQCIKFRTMVANAEAVLRQWARDNPDLHAEYLKTYKLVNDPRITRIGKWLRKTSLDELPQLWNVLRGDMSLVGPRPVVQKELEEHYGPATQLYIRTRPGMTGLWQVSGRSTTSYERRIFLDEWYILNWSFWYDIVILIQTFWMVIMAKGAY